MRIISGFICGVALLVGSSLLAETADEPVLRRCLVSIVEEARVPAREAGVLVELSVKEGDMVSRGGSIARIDDSQPRFEKQKASAEHDQAIARAKSDVDVRYSVAAEQVAEAEVEKAVASNRRIPGSVTQVELARLKLNQKKSELQIEQAQLERQLSALDAQSKEVEVLAAENRIQRRQIASPIDGMIVQVYPHLGEWMQPGDPLARVVRTDKLRVEGYVDSSKYEPSTVHNRPVTVSVMFADEREESFKGRIVFVSPLVEPGGDFRVWAEVENRQAKESVEWLLRAGQTATMTIHSTQPPLPPVHRTVTTADAE
ncbi:MAG: HlyD family efflux transporter periplasmic adaptor subunit [Planctomycetota bacterium]|nr:HlyD family efflux transporter periplasmic adaptor subunit [Planctomycetota bacterium]